MAAQDTLQIVKSFQAIDPVAAYFKSATVPDSARFGLDVAGMGDIDRDGVPDLAIGSRKDTIGPFPSGQTGAVQVLFMNANGTVRASKHISSFTDSLDVQLVPGDGFGGRVANIGDLNGDGMTDMAVLASGDDDGGSNNGAVYILFLDTAATVIGYQKISDTQGGFLGNMTGNTGFTSTVAEVGDMNGDGIQDLAVGSYLSNDGGTERGALWILLMNRNGTVNGFRKYSALSSWPGGNPLNANAIHFGFSAAKLGDLNGDGVNDIAVTAKQQGRGRVHILFLNANGSIKAYQSIGPGTPNLGGLQMTGISNAGHFGWSIDALGDLNGDGTVDLAFSLPQQTNHTGCVLIGYLKPNGTLQHEELISNSTGTGATPLNIPAESWFGFGLSAIGDLNGDHVMDLAVTSHQFNPGGRPEQGRLFTLNLNPKPLLLQVTPTDGMMGTSGIGSATVKVVGGVRPYQYLWGQGFPDEAAFDLWRDTTEVLPDSIFNAISYQDLLAVAAPRLDSLPSDVYYLRVLDQVDSARSVRFVISSPITNEVATGVSVSGGGKDYTKTASNGWTNTEVLTTNTMNTGEDGWMEFTLPQSGQMLAVGLREFGLAQLNGYEQMAHAFYFDGSTVRLWHEGALHNTGLTYATGDRFRLERTAGSVIYYKNEVPLDTVIDPTPKVYAIDLTLHTNGARIKGLSTGMYPAGTAIQIIPRVAITQMTCENPTAQVHATYSATQGITFTGLTYTWSPGPSPPNSADFSTTIPGLYTLTISGVHSGTTYSRSISFWLGYKVDWTELADCFPDGPPYTHTLKHIPASASGASAVSANESTDWEGHWVINTLSSVNAGPGTSEHLYFQDLIHGSDVAGVAMRRLFNGINYGIRAYRKTGASIATWDLPLTQQGKRLFTRVNGNHLVVKALPINGTSTPLWSVTWSNALSGTHDPHRIQGLLTYPNSRLVEVLTSLPCGEPQRTLLSEELQDGYHRADRKRLLFGYTEEYGDMGGTIACIVHAMDGTSVISTTLPVSYGYNKLELPLVSGGDELDEGFYWLEVTNAKGLKQYLRFHYQPLVP